jgi:hypothetical protein
MYRKEMEKKYMDSLITYDMLIASLKYSSSVTWAASYNDDLDVYWVSIYGDDNSFTFIFEEDGTFRTVEERS